MRLDSIITIERFIVDALISSPLIHLSVQVLRLADAIENEGIVNQSNTIVVRYLNSFTVDKNRQPVVTERATTFRIEYTCQNYLSSSGHDYALTLLEAVNKILRGKNPPSGSFQVVEGFRLQRETFEGLTDNSQYFYSQEWEIILEEVPSEIILDPCVSRGDCSQSWPPPNVLPQEQPIPEWNVIDEGKIYEPSCPSQPDLLTGGGVEQDPVTGDLIYKCDGTLFIPGTELSDLLFISTGVKTEEGFLVVRVFRVSDGSLYGEYVYSDSGLRITRLSGGLWKSPVDFVGVKPVSQRESLLDVTFKGVQGSVSALVNQDTIGVSDPLNIETSIKRKVVQGSITRVFYDTRIITSGFTWVLTNFCNGTPWIPIDTVVLTEIDQTACEILEENQPKGGC